MKIHVYTIAKNEEQFAERWVNSAKDADGLHVLDTGSSDNTVSKLVDLGVDVRDTRYESWKTLAEYHAIVKRGGKPWRFDEPRNTNLDMIPHNADVCLQVDMDEVLVPDWRKVVERFWTRGVTHMDYLYAWQMNGDVPERVFHYNKCHSRHGYRWVKPVHEVLWPVPNYKEQFSYCNTLLVKHLPDASKSRGSYLPLLELSCEEDPSNAANAFYLAREYTFNRMWPEAIAAAKKYLALPSAVWSLERCAVNLLAAESCGALKNHKEEEQWLLKAVAEDVASREGWCRLADHYRIAGQHLGGYYAAKRTLEITTPRPMTYIDTPETFKEKPHDIAAICGFYAGFKMDALDHAWQAVKENPFEKRLIDNYEITLKLVAPAGAKAELVPVVDVVMLSWAKDEEHYRMAVRAIENLRLASIGIPLNVVVVETNGNLQHEPFAAAPLFGENVTVIQPDEPFGYNRYLQIAYEHLLNSPSKFLMILNNDVVLFSKDFMVKLLAHAESYPSLSPLGLRELKWGRLDEHKPVHVGYDLNVTNGWCILFDKAILNAMPFEEFFPAELAFHRQDEYYADMLRLCGLRHALVTDAQALHLQAQSHAFLDEETKIKFTVGMAAPYARLLAEAKERRNPIKKPKVYDCFTFWRELDILEMRLNELDGVVDHFVLVEATRTHSGKDKQLFFASNKQRFAKFLHKIIHVVVEDMPRQGEDRWLRENFQRNAVMRGLGNAKPNDIVMISDVDEIPRAEVVKRREMGVYVYPMYDYYYNLRNTTEDWLGTVSVKRSELTTPQTPQTLRDTRHTMKRTENAGWHFSWIGDEASALEKLASFAHSEYDNADVKTQLGQRMADRVDLFGRSPKTFIVEEIKEPNFPRYLIQRARDMGFIDMSYAL